MGIYSGGLYHPMHIPGWGGTSLSTKSLTKNNQSNGENMTGHRALKPMLFYNHVPNKNITNFKD